MNRYIDEHASFNTSFKLGGNCVTRSSFEKNGSSNALAEKHKLVELYKLSEIPSWSGAF